MGNTVNIGARLETTNKLYGTTILVCEQTKSNSEKLFTFREIDTVLLAGKERPLTIYELIDSTNNITIEQKDWMNTYHKALSLYREKKWNNALETLNTCIQLNPNDHASQTLINRINKLKKKIIIQLGQAFGKYKLTIKDTIIMNIIKTC